MFFVPRQFEHINFPALPTSQNLRTALRKLGIRSLKDLNGISSHDFDRINPDGHSLVRELLRLVEQVRGGSIESESEHLLVGRLNKRTPKQVEGQNEASVACTTIPNGLRHLPVSDFCHSTKLSHLFAAKGVVFLGDLHTQSLAEFQSLPTFGKKTIEELRGLINDPNSKLWPSQDDQAEKDRRRTIHFFVPERVMELRLSQLRQTKRLRSAFEKIGATTLGDFHRLPTTRLQKLVNCGNGTIGEIVSLLNRAATGEFDLLVTDESSFGIFDFRNLVERVLPEFSSRNQEIILLRFWGKSNTPRTLHCIARSVGVSRERVRQIETDWLQRLQTAGGEKLRNLLAEFVPEECKRVTTDGTSLVFCSQLLQRLRKQPRRRSTEHP